MNWRRAVSLCLDQLDDAGALKESTVVLIGSYAHAAASSRSDVDILVIGEQHLPKLRGSRGVHLQFMDLQAFRDRLNSGDDYAVAAVRFGKIVHDGLQVWRDFQDHLSTYPWPDWREKYRYAKRRIQLARWLLEARDTEAASEEYLLVATQVGRAELLRRGIYPLSRPELSGQLRAVDETRLAGIISRLLLPEIGTKDLREISEELEAMVKSKAEE